MRKANDDNTNERAKQGLRGTETAKTPAQDRSGAAAGAPQVPHVPVSAF